jgi:hypothetical protein
LTLPAGETPQKSGKPGEVDQSAFDGVNGQITLNGKPVPHMMLTASGTESQNRANVPGNPTPKVVDHIFAYDPALSGGAQPDSLGQPDKGNDQQLRVHDLDNFIASDPSFRKGVFVGGGK